MVMLIIVIPSIIPFIRDRIVQLEFEGYEWKWDCVDFVHIPVVNRLIAASRGSLCCNNSMDSLGSNEFEEQTRGEDAV
jgi:hypothetical protein